MGAFGAKTLKPSRIFGTALGPYMHEGCQLDSQYPLSPIAFPLPRPFAGRMRRKLTKAMRRKIKRTSAKVQMCRTSINKNGKKTVCLGNILIASGFMMHAVYFAQVLQTYREPALISGAGVDT